MSEFAEDGSRSIAAAHLEDAALSPAELERYFGNAWLKVARFHALLQEHGEPKGLIGPREVSRIWTRHLLNSAALSPFLPDSGVVADIGTGAGLPGVVVAAQRPDLGVHLIEPMARRISWLADVAAELGLDNVTLHAARAEDLHGVLTVDAVTARAVAPLSKLAGWSLPLLRPGGWLLALKGRRAGEEIADAQMLLRKMGVARTEVHEVDPLRLGDPTSVVELVLRRTSPKRARR